MLSVYIFLTHLFSTARLSRLLHKHLFEEAEKFAIAFELDLEASLFLSVFWRKVKFFQHTTNFTLPVQLVYKVKLDFVLEQLASASVGGYGQDVWCELVEEARSNLTKITVSVTLLFLWLMLSRPGNCALVTQINNLCCPGWAVCGGILSQGSLANLWDSREDAKPRCHSILVFTNPRGLGETGNILQPARHRKFQVNSKLSGVLVCCKVTMLVFLNA